MKSTTLGITLALALSATFAFAQRGVDSADAIGGDIRPTGVEVGEPVTPFEYNVDLSTLPVAESWKPGDSIREAAKRQYYPLDAVKPHAPADWETAPDVLGDIQAQFERTYGLQQDTDASRADRVNLDNGFTGVFPGDPVVEVGTDHVIYGVNASGGTQFSIYNKTGTRLAGPTTFKSLAPAGDACTSSRSDPIVLFDRIANRWFMLEMGGANTAYRLCVYVSKTSNPVSGGWWFYGFATPALPDYPKCAVWPNSYICTDNESGSGAKIYAFDRANMLNGATARGAQRFTSVAKLAGYGFQALTPATLLGNTAPPSGAAPILARHNDDEAHAGTSANTSQDFIDLYQLNIDWNTPANSNVGTLPRIAITEFNSWFRNYSAFESVPQPSSTSLLDPIREVILNSMIYRNQGSYESIVGTFATNQNAARTGTTVDSGLRWFELRRTGTANWSKYQEGTFGPGDSNTHHLLGTIATDKQGNIGLAYNVTKTSSPAQFASLYYSGRLATDTLGVMTQAETLVVSGAAAETSGRWGDYYQMSVDPVDDCTFWFVGMYRPSGNWATRASHFKFNSCTGGTPPATYSISGAITTSGGAGISGVSVSTGSVSATTNSSGAYTISGLVDGSYTITPTLSGSTFTPSSRSVSVSGANVSGQNFTGATTTPPSTSFFENLADYAINDNATVESPIVVSGRTGNAPSNLQVGVRIIHTYIGDLKVDLVSPAGTVYVLHNRTGGSADNIITTYTVNASSEVANGTWRLRVNDNAGGDTGIIDSWSLNFGAAAPVTYSVSGAVTTSAGAGISGVVVSAGSASATTSSTGAYTINGLANATYTLSPSLSGYTFSPATRSVTVSGANQTGQNFTGTPPAAQPSFFENTTDYPINDNATVESPIAVSGRTGNAPSTLRVGVNILHTYIGDLKVDLVAPDGSVYVLHNRSGGGTDNIVTTYTVNASSEVANGTWRLRVNDNANQDTGRIDSWSLQF